MSLSQSKRPTSRDSRVSPVERVHYSPPDLISRMLAKSKAAGGGRLGPASARRPRSSNRWTWSAFEDSVPARMRTIAYAGGRTGDSDEEEEEDQEEATSCIGPCISVVQVDAERDSPAFWAMAVDTYSRLVIPLAFLLFCIWYWPTLLKAVSQ